GDDLRQRRVRILLRHRPAVLDEAERGVLRVRPGRLLDRGDPAVAGRAARAGAGGWWGRRQDPLPPSPSPPRGGGGGEDLKGGERGTGPCRPACFASLPPCGGSGARGAGGRSDATVAG